MNRIDPQVQQKVTTLLNWNDQQYTQLIYDCGLAYLSKIAGEFPAVFKQIQKSERFWNWWTHHWEKRDQEFIESCEGYESDQAGNDAIYKNLHDPDTLFRALYLNGKVLQEDYANLIAQITKEQHETKEDKATPEQIAVGHVA